MSFRPFDRDTLNLKKNALHLPRRFSGVTEEDLENVTISLRDVQAVLLSMFSAETILIGHSLESDLLALKVSLAPNKLQWESNVFEVLREKFSICSELFEPNSHQLVENRRLAQSKCGDALYSFQLLPCLDVKFIVSVS